MRDWIRWFCCLLFGGGVLVVVAGSIASFDAGALVVLFVALLVARPMLRWMW